MNKKYLKPQIFGLEDVNKSQQFGLVALPPFLLTPLAMVEGLETLLSIDIAVVVHQYLVNDTYTYLYVPCE